MAIWGRNPVKAPVEKLSVREEPVWDEEFQKVSTLLVEVPDKQRSCSPSYLDRVTVTDGHTEKTFIEKPKDYDTMEEIELLRLEVMELREQLDRVRETAQRELHREAERRAMEAQQIAFHEQRLEAMRKEQEKRREQQARARDMADAFTGTAAGQPLSVLTELITGKENE